MGENEPREPSEQAQAPEPERPAEAPPVAEVSEPVPTSFRRNAWLLVIVLAVVVLAWILALLWKRVPESIERIQKAAGPVAETSAPRTATSQASQRPEPPEPGRVIGSNAEMILAAPALAVEPGGVAYRLPRFFDVTKRIPGFELQHLLRMPGRWADQRPVLDAEKAQDFFKPAESVSMANALDRIVVVSVGEFTRAYPIKVLAMPDGVRDVLGGTPVFVCWNPATQMARCLRLEADGKRLDFRDAGLLYRGNDLQCDVQTGSLWDPFSGRALAGSAAGQRLETVPVMVVLWGAWAESHPSTQVLTAELDQEGEQATRAEQFERATERYLQNPAAPESLAEFDATKSPLPAKAFVLGLTLDGQSRAYPLSRPVGAPATVLQDTLAGQAVEVHVTSDRTGYAISQRRLLDACVMLWFAWTVACPDTGVYNVPADTSVPADTAAVPVP